VATSTRALSAQFVAGNGQFELLEAIGGENEDSGVANVRP